MDRRFLHNSSSSCSADATFCGEAPAAFIELPLIADSLIERSPEKPEKAKDHLPHEHCCRASKLMETTTEPQRKHASIRGMAANMGDLRNHDGGERRREKLKRFVADKGPRIAGAAAAIGMFIFNVVTSCS